MGNVIFNIEYGARDTREIRVKLLKPRDDKPLLTSIRRGDTAFIGGISANSKIDLTQKTEFQRVDIAKLDNKKSISLCKD